MIRDFRIADGQLVPTGNGADVRLFVSPDDAELEELHRAFGVDTHTIASALDPDEVPRIEAAPGGLHMVWKRPASITPDLERAFGVSSLGLFLRGGQLGILSAHELPVEWATQSPPKSAEHVLLNVLDGTIRDYLAHVKLIKTVSRELETKVATSLENRYLWQMLRLSESLVYYVDALYANGVVLEQVRKQLEARRVSPDVLARLDDVHAENRQCNRQAEIYSTVLTGLMDARGNLVNNNMNVLLKKLTIINVVFLPLNLVAGVFGMSEYTRLTEGLPFWLSYPLFLLAMFPLGWLTAILVQRVDAHRAERTSPRE